MLGGSVHAEARPGLSGGYRGDIDQPRPGGALQQRQTGLEWENIMRVMRGEQLTLVTVRLPMMLVSTWALTWLMVCQSNSPHTHEPGQ